MKTKTFMGFKASLVSCYIFVLSLQVSLFGQDFPLKPCDEKMSTNNGYIKETELRNALNRITAQGVPGVVASVYDKEGLWSCAGGFSRIEDKTAMQTCQLQYLQSISKSYMAVVIMQLFEEGRIDLDAPITNYLPQKITGYLPFPGMITVTMLLNHTSGLPEYNYDPVYITRLLQDPLRIFSPMEYMAYLDGKPLDFEPGSQHSYRNTNYVLLALIADKITGDHAKFMNDHIFVPLGLKNTFYNIGQGNTYGNRLVNSYWDRYGNGIIENISVLQNSNVASMAGDDGIITTPEEAIVFLKGLMEGKLVSHATLDLMKKWCLNKEGEPEYGLGLDYTKFNGLPAIGHSGGGLGSGCQLYYVPEKDVYFFLAINLGTVTESPIHANVVKILDEIHAIILNAAD